MRTKVPSNRMAVLAVMGVVLMSLVFAWAEPFKVRDPNDPRFDPLRYKFTDYKYDNHWVDPLRKIFAPGMDRRYVERIIVDSAGARASEIDRGFISYGRRVPFSPDTYGILALYDDAGKLVAMNSGRGGVIEPSKIQEAIQASIIHERERKGVRPP